MDSIALKLSVCIFVLIPLISLESQAQQQQPYIPDQCIGCICFASTGCKKDTGCNADGVCGPLLISWPYWADGGKYVIKGTSPNDQNAYPQCAQDLFCAAETLRGYMSKYQRDCNGDGRIDCDDFARIHKRGPGSCNDPGITETSYYREYSTCASQLNI